MRDPTPINWGIVIVPQQKAYVIERLGRFQRVLTPGINLLLPIIDSIAYTHSLKEFAVTIPNQTAITTDNVTISIDGVLFYRILDPVKASYGAEDYRFAITQLAQTTMRSALGQMSLDKTFAERDTLNAKIVEAINGGASSWGIECLRYEIRDITPPASVRIAMDMQAEAERKKRAQILESEGSQQSVINIAEGQRQSVVLKAQGDAQATLARARATARGVSLLAESVRGSGGQQAVSLRIAEQYVSAFSKLAKKSNTILLPSSASDPASMVAQAMAIYDKVVKNPSLSSSPSSSSSSSLPLPEPPAAKKTENSFSLADNLQDDYDNLKEDSKKDEEYLIEDVKKS
jgi:regulator of protease activity HflC (stomatin/prohibitin superfamily)